MLLLLEGSGGEGEGGGGEGGGDEEVEEPPPLDVPLPDGVKGGAAGTLEALLLGGVTGGIDSKPKAAIGSSSSSSEFGGEGNGETGGGPSSSAGARRRRPRAMVATMTQSGVT